MPQSEAQIRWNKANPERLRAAKQRYAEKNREKLRAAARARYLIGGPTEKTRQREYSRAFRARLADNPEKWLKAALVSAKHRAAKKGVPFGLLCEDVALPERCPVLGVVLKYGGCGLPHNKASLDRIIPSLGYVTGNVRVIALLANSCRQNCLDPAIFEALAEDARRLADVPDRA